MNHRVLCRVFALWISSLWVACGGDSGVEVERCAMLQGNTQALPNTATLCQAADLAFAQARQAGAGLQLLSIDAVGIRDDGTLPLDADGLLGQESLSVGWTFRFRYADGSTQSLRYRGGVFAAQNPVRSSLTSNPEEQALALDALPKSEALMPELRSRKCDGDGAHRVTLTYQWSPEVGAPLVEYLSDKSYIVATLSEGGGLKDFRRACR